MKKVSFYTLGCKVNQYETEVMREMFEKNGYTVVDFEEKADVIIINSCSVTAIADRKTRRTINKAAKLSPEAIIAVTGCYSQTSPQEVAGIKSVDIVIGNGEKSEIVEIIENFRETKYIQVGDIMQNREFQPLFASANTGKTRALIKIEEGCNNFCSYCIIPYARGPVRSRDKEDILKEATMLSQAGYKEIVLTGIHITSYGTDKGNDSLADIIMMLHEVEGIERIRLGSLELTSEMHKIAELADKMPMLCHQFHMSLQSGSDSVLKRMNRRYTSAQYADAVEKLKSAFSGVAITTDIMVGFPGETEEEFEESRRFAEKVGFAKVHVFPYSPRRGTVAAKMPDQIDEKVKKDRAKKMQTTEKKLEKAYLLSIVGKTLKVLFETEKGKGVFEGHAENYMPVRVKSDTDITGQIVDVKILEVKDGCLIGKMSD